MVRPASPLVTIALLCAIVLGAFIRVHDVAAKTLFADEAFSVLRITGHTEGQVRALADGSVRPVSEIQALQRPDEHTSVAATLSSIGTEEPQRGPLYYGVATLWLEIGGTSIAGLRTLAVIVGLLLLAVAYLFGRVAFANPLGGLYLAALIAVSPFHLAYARQTREYGLFAVMVLLSATALLLAMREGTPRRWIALGATLVFGLLTTPLFAMVLISYAAYALWSVVKRSQKWTALVPFACCAATAIVVVAPWYAYVARVAEKVGRETAWGESVYPIRAYLEKIAFEIGAVFFDYEFAHVAFGTVLVLVGAAAAYLIFRAGRNDAVVFGSTLALPTVLVLVGNDLRDGAHFATIARYATPVWLALEIVVVAGAVARRNGNPLFAPGAIGTLLLAGAFCAVADRPYAQWWDNNDNVPVAEVGRIADTHPHGVVLISKYPLALSLAHYLDDSLRVQLYSDDATPSLRSTGRPNMLFVPTPAIRAAIARLPSVAGLDQVVTDPAPNATSDFHAKLAKASGTPIDPNADDISAQNALWIVEPAT